MNCLSRFLLCLQNILMWTKTWCSVNLVTLMSEHTTSAYYISGKLLIPKHQQIWPFCSKYKKAKGNIRYKGGHSYRQYFWGNNPFKVWISWLGLVSRKSCKYTLPLKLYWLLLTPNLPSKKEKINSETSKFQQHFINNARLN